MNLDWAPNLITGQQEEITLTINPDATVTSLPTDTLYIQNTQTSIPTFIETPTLTMFKSVVSYIVLPKFSYPAQIWWSKLFALQALGKVT